MDFSTNFFSLLFFSLIFAPPFFHPFYAFGPFSAPFWHPFFRLFPLFFHVFFGFKFGPIQGRKNLLFDTSKTSFFTIKQVVFTLSAFFANVSNFIDFRIHFRLLLACFSHQVAILFYHWFFDTLFFVFLRFLVKNGSKKGWSRRLATPPLTAPGATLVPTRFFLCFWCAFWSKFW